MARLGYAKTKLATEPVARPSSSGGLKGASFTSDGQRPSENKTWAKPTLFILAYIYEMPACAGITGCPLMCNSTRVRRHCSQIAIPQPVPPNPLNFNKNPYLSPYKPV